MQYLDENNFTPVIAIRNRIISSLMRFDSLESFMPVRSLTLRLWINHKPITDVQLDRNDQIVIVKVDIYDEARQEWRF